MQDDYIATDAPAFSTENNAEDAFKFDVQETSTPQTDTGTDTNTSDDSSSPVGNEQDEQKVPYSRFKKKVDEVHEYSQRIAELERVLGEMQDQPRESSSEAEPPAEWTQLYGDSEASKKAFAIQTQREQQLQERAVELAIERIQRQQEEQVSRLAENEEFIDNGLQELADEKGLRLTPKMEEEILTIVDEFSPTGSDGKYLSMIPFDKAYEIYTLRNGVKTQKTSRARQSIANLSSENSAGESNDSNSSIGNSWDSWRQAL